MSTTDTPRDDVTSDDLREQEHAARLLLHDRLHYDLAPENTDLHVEVMALVEDYAQAVWWRERHNSAEHTAREVQTARAEQREQIVAALEGAPDQPGLAGRGLLLAADIVREVGQP